MTTTFKPMSFLKTINGNNARDYYNSNYTYSNGHYIWNNKKNIPLYHYSNTSIEIEEVDANGNNSFLLAVQNNMIELVKQILTLNDKIINYQNNSGETALLIASKLGFYDIVKLLIEKNIKIIKINMCDNFKYTALINAVKFNHYDITKLLLDNEASYYSYSNITDMIIPESLILTAIKNNNIKIFDLLREKGYKYKNIYPTITGTNNIDNVKLLTLTINNLPSKQSKNNIIPQHEICLLHIPLHVACSYGHLEMVKHLLSIDIGCDIREQSLFTDNNHMLHIINRNALYYATIKGHLHIIEYLLSLDNELYNFNTVKYDLIFYALTMKFFNIVSFFIENRQQFNINIYKTINKKENILHLSCIYGYEIYRYHDININELFTTNDYGNNPLMFAIQYKHFNIADYLLEHRKRFNINIYHSNDINITNIFANSTFGNILHLSATHGYINIFKHLGNDALLFKSNYHGNTPVMLAIMNKQFNIADYLFQSFNFDIFHVNNKKENIIHLSAKYGYDNIFNYINDVTTIFNLSSMLHEYYEADGSICQVNALILATEFKNITFADKLLNIINHCLVNRTQYNISNKQCDTFISYVKKYGYIIN